MKCVHLGEEEVCFKQAFFLGGGGKLKSKQWGGGSKGESNILLDASLIWLVLIGWLVGKKGIKKQRANISPCIFVCVVCFRAVVLLVLSSGSKYPGKALVF